MNSENKKRNRYGRMLLSLFLVCCSLYIIFSYYLMWDSYVRNDKEEKEENARVLYFKEKEKIEDTYFNENGPVKRLDRSYRMNESGIEELAEDARTPILKILDIDDKKRKFKKDTLKDICKYCVKVNDVYVKENNLNILIITPTGVDVSNYKEMPVDREYYQDASVDSEKYNEINMVSSEIRNIVLGSLYKFGDKVDVHVTLGKVVKDEYNKDKFVAYRLLLNKEQQIYSEYFIKSSDFKKIENFETYTMRQLNALNNVDVN